ncbi:phosphoethanolamine transferase [Providencia stuartii]|uniref:phosphoethanolamine transferase n=1 Tax=Providencia stuartii TaxID=588 RepID=UPI0027E8BDDB|nr:phosphoethanolamine transferase [Providencia stuartii]MDQ5990055.1 phosphoethanolamine transferase [Providencia stuartii]
MRKTIQLLKSKTVISAFVLFAFFSIIHFSMGYYFKPFYVLAMTGLMLYLNQYRKIYIAIILFYTIIASLYFPVGILYGPPDYNIFSSFYYTNTEEAKGFISNINLRYYALSVLIFFFGMIVCRIKIDISKKVKMASLLVFIIIYMIQPVKAIYNNSPKLFLTSGLPETRFFTESLYYLDYLKKEKESIEGEDTFGKVTVNNKYDTYVIVIGESVRRDFMHKYGFPINNTPFMNGLNGIFFDNYISAAGSTNFSLSRSLSLYPTMPNNIITLANKAGFSTYWISRQGQSGKHDGPVASIAKRANETYFVGGKSKISEHIVSDDGPIIPKFIQLLSKPAKKKLIVIHLIGSHSPFCARVSNSYDQFYKSKDLSCYVQSIKNTDLLLSQVYSELSKSKGTWSMLYFSDHGLSFIDNQQDLIHGYKKKQNFEVPLFITSSDSTQYEVISAQRNGINLFQLFSEWLGIDEMSIKHTCKMLSNEICDNQHNVVNSDQFIIDFNTLSADDIE